jgi:hypothetical protein
MDHVDNSLQLLRNNPLFVKHSKCDFGPPEVEYLDHIVSQEGVQDDPKKVVDIQDCPHPKTLKRLRGFLGIIDHYRKFVKNYGKISTPLNSLLKKNSFFLSEVAAHAFVALKDVVYTTPKSVLLDFKNNLVLEYVASWRGLGEVLMQ